MSDHDKAAVEALLKVFDSLHLIGAGERSTARAIIDAIRKGEVPILGMVTSAEFDRVALAVDAARHEESVIREDRDALAAERDQLRAELSACRADLAGDPRTLCDRVADSMRSRERALEVERDQLRAEVERKGELAHLMEQARDRQIERADKAEKELAKEADWWKHHQAEREQHWYDRLGRADDGWRQEKARADKAEAANKLLRSELIPAGWDVLEQSGCPRCGDDVVAEPAMDGDGFIDGNPARCQSCGLSGQVTVDDNGAHFSEDDRQWEIDAVSKRADKAERERDEARAALAVERQHRDGHLPSCAGIDREEGRCGCGYLDGTAYRDMTARMEQATALLREVQDDSINGLTLGEARALYERVNEFLAGQPAPAKPVVNDAMVERAARAIDPWIWDTWPCGPDIKGFAPQSRAQQGSLARARAALVAALEGRI